MKKGILKVGDTVKFTNEYREMYETDDNKGYLITKVWQVNSTLENISLEGSHQELDSGWVSKI